MRLQEKQEFIQRALKSRPKKTAAASEGCHSSNQQLSADEMSVFYKDFLDRKHQEHVEYNRQWQKRNLKIAGLSFMVSLEGLFRRSS